MSEWAIGKITAALRGGHARLFAQVLVVLALPIFVANAQDTLAPTSPIELTPCRLESLGGFSKVKALCGTLRRPLNPQDENGKTIDLFVAKIPALSRHPATSALTYIAGGPGQSSIQAFVSTRGAFERIRRQHDIVLVDQRGTGKSSRQQCDAPDETESLDPADWSAAETREFAKNCADELGDDVRFYTTSIAVQDLEAVRAAFGYEQLDVYGISYGTRVAQHYLRRYPDRTRTVILDGVAPVTIPLGPSLAIDAQRALDMVFDRCASDVACSRAFGDIREKFNQLKVDFKRHSKQLQLPDPISGRISTSTFGYGELLLAVRLMSYSPDMVALLPLMIDNAAKGNYQPLAAQALLNLESISEMLAYGMHNTVVCAEDVPYFASFSFDKTALKNSYMGDLSYKSLIETCTVWPQGAIDPDFKVAFQSASPVLLLSGEADPVTPPAYGEMAAEYLGHARHIVVGGQGHGQAHVGCIPKVMADFVLSGNFSEPENTCWKVQQASPFFSSFSGPEP